MIAMQSWVPLIPESASTYSGDVDALYFYISGVTVFFTLLISFILIFFVVKYRRRNPFEIPRPIEGSTKLETLWSVIPLLQSRDNAPPICKPSGASNPETWRWPTALRLSSIVAPQVAGHDVVSASCLPPSRERL